MAGRPVVDASIYPVTKSTEYQCDTAFYLHSRGVPPSYTSEHMHDTDTSLCKVYDVTNSFIAPTMQQKTVCMLFHRPTGRLNMHTCIYSECFDEITPLPPEKRIEVQIV